MNFLGHAHLAAEHDPDPRYVLGAMLPDLASMARARIREVREPRVRAGVRFHHETDEAFHGAPTFVRWNRDGIAALEAAGVRRGPARAVAHVGAELLLDGWLVEDRGLPAGYRGGFDQAGGLSHAVEWEPGPRGGTLSEVCARLSSSELHGEYRDPVRVAFRLERLLAPRRLLAIASDERRAIERWCHGFRERLPQDATQLLEEVGARLFSYPPPPRRTP